MPPGNTKFGVNMYARNFERGEDLNFVLPRHFESESYDFEIMPAENHNQNKHEFGDHRRQSRTGDRVSSTYFQVSVVRVVCSSITCKLVEKVII